VRVFVCVYVCVYARAQRYTTSADKYFLLLFFISRNDTYYYYCVFTTVILYISVVIQYRIIYIYQLEAKTGAFYYYFYFLSLCSFAQSNGTRERRPETTCSV